MNRCTVFSIAASLMFVGQAHAAFTSYAFSCITTGLAADCAAGEAQAVMDVRDTSVTGQALATGQVLFVFRNLSGPRSASSRFSEIYFDDGSLLSIAQVQNFPGVSFTNMNVNPANLPGGNTLSPQFETTAGFSIDRTGSSANGVDPGEQVGVLFNLLPNKTIFDVVQGLNGAVTDANGAAALRVGIHVIAFADGASVSLINGTGGGGAAVVPVPATLPLLLAGLLPILASVRRRRTERAGDRSTPELARA